MTYLWLTSLIWGLSFGLIKAEVSGLDPVLVSAIRLGLSTLVFLPLIRRTKTRLTLILAAVGAIQFGAMYCLYISAYGFLDGHEIAILTVTTPLMVVLIDAGLMRRWRTRDGFAAILAILGALALVVTREMPEPALWGLVLVQAANLCFAAGQILYKRVVHPRHPGQDRDVFGWMYLGAVMVPLSMLVIQSDPIELPRQASQWWSLVYLGLIPSGLGFFWWNKGVAQVASGTVAVMNNVKVPAAVLLAWGLFGETVAVGRITTSLILLGAALSIAHRPR